MDTIKQKTKFMITSSSLLSDSQRDMIQHVTEKYSKSNSDLNCYQDEMTNFITIESNDIQICETICRELFPSFPDASIALTLSFEKVVEDNPSVFLRNFIKPSDAEGRIPEIYNISYIYTVNSVAYLVQASGVENDSFKLEISDIIGDLDNTKEIYTSTLQAATDLLQSH